MKSKYWRIALCAAILFSSCVTDHVSEIIVSDVPVRWSKLDPVEVAYENTDTLALKKMDVLVRFRNDFAFDRLDFVLETQSPDSLYWQDTVSVFCTLPALTEVSSLTYTDVKTVYRSHSRLSRTGVYRFRFTPLMPETYLKGIAGVGIEVTKN